MESNKNSVENIKMLFGNFLDSVTESNSELLRREEELRSVVAVLNEKIIQYEDRVTELERRILEMEEVVNSGNMLQSGPVDPEAEPGEMHVAAESQMSEEEPMFILEEEEEPVVILPPEAEPQVERAENADQPVGPVEAGEEPEPVAVMKRAEESPGGGKEVPAPAPGKGEDLFSGIPHKEEKRTILEAAKPDWYDWEVDYPASYIDDIAGGIGFNDKILFLKELFRNDEALFSAVIKKLNDMGSFRGAVDYMRENFPEWNEERDEVYRFYMNVRRKLRK